MEEVVLRKVLVGVVRVQFPPVVNVEVEDAENKHQHDSRELGLEAHNHHDASHESQKTSDDSPEAPVAAEHESNKEEDEENASSELEIHLLVLLVKLGKAGRRKLLAHPRVGEHHEQTAHDGQVAQEEVEVKDKAVANALQDHDGHESRNAVLGVLSENDAEGADGHEDDVGNEEHVRDAVPDCKQRETVLAIVHALLREE